MGTARVIALGEALVEFIRAQPGEPLDTPGSFEGPFLGGAPAIFAGACARLGVQTTLLSRVGDDPFGRLVQTQLARESLDMNNIIIDPIRPTACSFVAYRLDGQRDFMFYQRTSAGTDPDARWSLSDLLLHAQWLHVCGSTLCLSSSWAEVCARAARLARAAGAQVSFDPNIRPELLGERSACEVCAPLLAQATVVLPSGAEAMLVTGERTPEEACHSLLQQGVELVVLKRGAEGASAFTAAGRVDAAPFPVNEVDPTGAGDVFAAGLVSALLAGHNVPTALRHACAAGALSVTQRSPLAGAPTRRQLAAFLSAQS